MFLRTAGWFAAFVAVAEALAGVEARAATVRPVCPSSGTVGGALSAAAAVGHGVALTVIVGQVSAGDYRDHEKQTLSSYMQLWITRQVEDGMRPSTERGCCPYIDHDIPNSQHSSTPRLTTDSAPSTKRSPSQESPAAKHAPCDGPTSTSSSA